MDASANALRHSLLSWSESLECTNGRFSQRSPPFAPVLVFGVYEWTLQPTLSAIRPCPGLSLWSVRMDASANALRHSLLSWSESLECTNGRFSQRSPPFAPVLVFGVYEWTLQATLSAIRPCPGLSLWSVRMDASANALRHSLLSWSESLECTNGRFSQRSPQLC